MVDQPSLSSISAPTFWTGQATHFIGLSLLLLLTWIAWHFIGNPFPVLFWIAIAFPIMHQIFVWITWRLKLQPLSATAALTFPLYLVIFFVLFAGRFVSLLALAWVDRRSLQLPVILQVILTAFFTVPGVYAMYSVWRYFGLGRAAGADHLIPDIVTCRWSDKVSFGSQTTECIYTPFFCSGQLPSLSIRWQRQLLLGIVTSTSGYIFTQPRNPTWNTCTGNRQ